MDDEGNRRHSDFEEQALNAMRPEKETNYSHEASGREGDEEAANTGGFYHPNDRNEKKEAKRYAASDLNKAEQNATGAGGGVGNSASSSVGTAKEKESSPNPTVSRRLEKA